MRLLTFFSAGLASALAACGGNVVVDHGSGNGGSGNGGSGLGGTPLTGTGTVSPGTGGSTGDVVPVGATTTTGSGGSTMTGMDPTTGVTTGTSVTTGTGPADCPTQGCSVSQNSCDCSARCHGHRYRADCRGDATYDCKCIEDGAVVGTCQQSGNECGLTFCCAQFFR